VNAGSYCPCSAQAEKDTVKDYSFDIFESIGSVTEFQWNKLIPEPNVLMQYEHLKLIETSQAGKMEFRYVFIKKQHTAIGVAYFQIVRFTGNDLVNYFPNEPAGTFKRYAYRIVRTISEPVIRSIDLKLLVSGNVFMTGENGFYFHHEQDKRTRAATLRKAVRDIASGDPKIKAVLISDLYEPKTDFDIDFKSYGYSEITVESDMSIKLNPEWKSLNDYLNAFSSKYRVRARKVFSMCNENGVERKDLTADEIEKYQDDLYNLYNKVIERADFKLASLSKDFFVLQKRLCGDNYRVFAYFKDGRMIGFISLFNFYGRMEVHYTGMDQAACKPIHLYQHMMYDMVEFGILNKCDKLHFGRTAPEIKSTIGAVPSPMYGYVKHFNPLFNLLLVRTFTANLKPKAYTIRSPFK
jgi:predicted N-acyltransferase